MTGGQRSNNRKLYNRLVSLLPRLRDTAKLNQIEIVSCTPNSAANVHLEYVPLEEALKKSAERVPSHLGHEVLHAEHARMCRWMRDTVPSGDGLLTGADANQEWLLPWWYENVRKHNECPVAFADFGLSPELRAWCSERGLVLEVPEVPGLTWHKKPFAILASPFKRTVWLDADCEVRGELGVVFPYADKGIGLTLDPHSKTCRQPGALATGVVACAHGEPGIEEWCKEILLRPYRGDQEAFDAIRDRLSARVTVMPRGFQWLRLDEENEDVLVMHWTGGIGKRQIQIKDQLPALA